jgi:hypothetical protein
MKKTKQQLKKTLRSRSTAKTGEQKTKIEPKGQKDTKTDKR